MKTYPQKHVGLPIALVAIVLLCFTLQASPLSAVFYNVAQAPDHASTLPPVYTNGADFWVEATSLVAHGVSPSYDCCIEGPGDFIFTGWAVKDGPINWTKYIDFTVTAKKLVTLKNLKYSAFGGYWSNMGGCRGVIVQASRDGFGTNVTTIRSGGWNLQLTSPYQLDCPNDFVDSLAGLGLLAPGQNLTIRFYLVYSDYGHIPSGLWNKSPNDFNPTIEFGEIEPLTVRFSQVELCWGTATNTWYQLQYTTSLSSNPVQWIPMMTNWVAGDGLRHCTNDAIIVGEPQKAYRLQITDAP